LTIPDVYERRLEKVRDYIEGEMKALGDDTLEQESETVERILGHS